MNEPTDLNEILSESDLQRFTDDGLLSYMDDGVYIKPASAEPVYVDTPDGEVVEVVVDNREYELCEFSSRLKVWAQEKSNIGYHDGVANSADDPKNVERTGRVGEVALAKLVSGRVDISYRPGGDTTDVVVHGKGLDIKTAVKYPYKPQGYIMVHNEKGPAPMKSDVYIFGYKHSEDRQNGVAVVRIVGGISKKNIEETCPLMPSSHGDWINRVVFYSDLAPIRKVLEWAR